MSPTRRLWSLLAAKYRRLRGILRRLAICGRLRPSATTFVMTELDHGLACGILRSFADATRHPLHVARREALIERRPRARSTASLNHNKRSARRRASASPIRNTRVAHDRRYGLRCAGRSQRGCASAAVAAAARAAVHRSVARSPVRPRREAMTSRSSMPAQRRHPRHPNDSASAAWSARCSARTHNRFSPTDMWARGRLIMEIWLTVAEASRYSGARRERGYGDGC
jgi:hypothetical protein